MAVETRGNDLVLTTGQFAYLLDRTKGNVINYVGPSKTSMSETDVPVIWDAAKRSFAFCDMKEAIKPFICAGENDYIVLQNPADDKKDEHPKEATGNNLARLNMGRTINIRGPAWFALWPGQEAKVVPGHTLRSNQFLIVQVSNDEAAKENWAKAVIKPQVVVEKVPPPNAQQPEPNAHGAKADEAASTAGSAPQALASQLTPSVQNENKPPANLSIGQRFVIAGKAVSFYIPPTGLEVVPDEKDSLVRDAVSLEQLEYCILLDENGEKKVITGPAVVFPEPTQTFLEIDSKRKFRAIELNQLMAIHVKVIAPYKEGDKEIKAGEELFITGKEQAIYFPRPEHAIIKHGDQLIHYAVAIPAGEARYVLGRETGSVRVIKGPTMLLPDARKEVIARRVLDSTQVQLWYPGNNRAKQVNEELAVAAQSSGGLAGLGRMLVGQATAVNAFTTTQGSATDFSAGEQLSRKTSFTPPRAITLDNKFDGVVTVEVWNGYAVLVVSKTGKRDVVQGPKSILLEFDETLMPVEFSTGTPKSAERSIKTVFLRTLNNRVSDAVSAETSDLVGVNIQLSYRVNFEGDKSKWFDVENYIQFLCDHTRSLIRNMVRKHGIQAFQQNYIDLIRDVILGVPSEKDKSRSGRNFVENGMRIYDVEVLDVHIGDAQISEDLEKASHDAVERTLRVSRAEAELAAVKKEQAYARETQQQAAETKMMELKIQNERIQAETALALAQVDKNIKTAAAEQEARLVADRKAKGAELELKKVATEIEEMALKIKRDQDDHEIEVLGQRNELTAKMGSAEAASLKEKAAAFTPHLIASLQAFGDKDLAVKLATAMAPLAIMRDKSVATTFVELARGTGIEAVVSTIFSELRQKPAPQAD